MSVIVSAPIVCCPNDLGVTPPPEAVPTPISVLPLKSGILNVVVPFPTPQTVPIAANKGAKTTLSTALPSHSSHP